VNVASYLTKAARIWPQNTALSLGKKPFATYEAFARDAAVMANNLGKELKPGDRVALVMTNRPEYLVALYGIWHAGLTAVPVNAKLHPKEFAYILEHSEAKLCLVSADLEEKVSCDRKIVVGSAEWAALLAGDPAPMAETADDDVAWLFYTSGTTGQPKGAMLTHKNIHAMTLSYFADVDAVSAGDSILHAAPISHGSGMYNFPHVLRGATQIIPESAGFEPAEIFDLIEAFEGVAFFAAPTMVKRLVEAPEAAKASTDNLKTIVYGGGPMYVADLKKAMDVLGPKLVQIYGQGESPMTITALSKDLHRAESHANYEGRLASVGVAHSVVEVRVRDHQGNVLPIGEPGEVCVRGDTVMKGYWKNEEATAETIVDGWLYTGDMGRMDEDGFLTLMDRSKDMIISGGSNIYPREIEEVLQSHPEVVEVSVVGMPHHDWGEVVVAFVVPTKVGAVEESDLDALCLENIARFKRPKEYRFVEALPKNNYGKILKTELRELL